MIQSKKKRISQTLKRKTKRVWKSSFDIKCLFFFLFIGIILFFYQRFSVRQAERSVPSLIKDQSYQIYSGLEIPEFLSKYPEQIIFHTGYTVSYNEEWRLPNWVAYELLRSEIQGKENSASNFNIDPDVEGISATNKDYLHSGYDKGHLAPVADMKWNAIAIRESFYFSNICPQHPKLNRRCLKDLEKKIRNRVIADSAIVIVCGPLVEKGTKVIGNNRVTVPEGFFKVILSPYVSLPQAVGFIFKNKVSTESLRTYAVTVDSVERVTSMNFFTQLPDELENRIESQFDISYWGL
jgi:endonuclease G